MRKLFLSICAAAALPLAAIAQTQDADELMSQLYTPIVQAYQTQNWAEVASLVERLIAAGADIDELEVTYDIALNGLGQSDKAVERLASYLVANPDDYMAWMAMGSARQQLGLAQAAIEAYEKSVELAPTFGRPIIALAKLYGAGNPAKAMENYNKGIRLALQARQPAVAISLGSEAMGIDDKNLDTLMLLGDALSMAGLYDNALAFYAEAVDVAGAQADPDVEAVQECAYHIAMISYRQGSLDRAESLVGSLLANADYMQQHPDAYVETLCLAAAVSSKQGDAASAQSYLDQAKAIDPETAQSLYVSLLEF